MNQLSRRLDHLQAEERYRLAREAAYETAMERFPDINIRGISFHDAVLADSWKCENVLGARQARSSWEWVREYSYYQNRPKRFEVSLSRGGLAALCYGQLSKKGTRVRLNLIESSPARPSPLGLRAVPILSVVASMFANVVGAQELWILDPDPNLEGMYQAQGFGGIEIYHGRRVGQRRVL